MIRVRANGGYKIHALDEGKQIAYCGHAPARTGFRMKPRGKWLVPKDQRVPITCDKCRAYAESKR